MSLRRKLRRALQSFGDRPLISSLVHHPAVRRALEPLPGGRAFYGTGWERAHPFDRAEGIDTSGFFSSEELFTDANGFHAYAGSQPSILRTVFATIPAPETCAFIDLGCGKGRPLFVATEFPFREIVGVEISPGLAAVAKRNANRVAARHPERTRVRIEVSDASAYPFPAGDLVLFLYNPFGAEIIAQVVASVEKAMREEPRSLYVVYYNPVFGACFDASPLLTRRFAQTLQYAADERGFGPDRDDPVVIWQGGSAPLAPEPADAKIVVTIPNLRAELVAG